MNDAGAPSVVVIPLVGGDALRACLRAVLSQTSNCTVIYPHRHGTAESWKQDFPAVRFVEVGDRPIPALRMDAVKAARGDIVALIEDTSRPAHGWCAAIREAFSDPRIGAVGGPVSVAADLPPRFQALGYSEYGRFGAQTTGTPYPARRIPGNNLAYRRASLLEAFTGSNDGIFEDEAIRRLRERGLETLTHPRMAVTYAAADSHGAYLSTRLAHGRLFAADRVRDRPLSARIGWFAKSFLLPFVLTARGMGAAMGEARVSQLPMILIWLFAMETSWAIGEGIGYLAGRGQSLDSWR